MKRRSDPFRAVDAWVNLLKLYVLRLSSYVRLAYDDKPPYFFVAQFPQTVLTFTNLVKGKAVHI